MNIKVKLASLIIINSLGFLLAFVIYLFFSAFVNDIEWEKEDLQLLADKAQSVRVAGANMFVGHSLEEGWYTFEIQMKNLEIHNIYLDRLRILPSLNSELKSAIDIIKNLEALTLEQYEHLSADYIEIKNHLELRKIFLTFSFDSYLNHQSFLSERDWLLLRLSTSAFRESYIHLDFILDNSIRVINEEMYFIESETSRISKFGLILSLSLAFLIIGIMLFISLSISQRIASDMVRIDKSLSSMLTSTDMIVIDVYRNDELGDLARNIESIFNELIVARDQLIQSEKMASLGELVAGVAHEINTPIGIGVTASSHIIEQVKELKSLFDDDVLTQEDFVSSMDSLKESSEIILSNMQRAAGLIKGFKQVAVDQSSQEARCFNVLDFLKDIKQSLKPLIKKTRIKVRINCDDNLEISSIPGLLSQIITNLIQNSALHAFSGSSEGRIFISVSSDSKGVQLIFKDNGSGMTAETLERIFDPFFTTKRGSGGGSGLGLHIVYNLVTQGLGGTISCKSAPGEGTEFTIHFKELDKL